MRALTLWQPWASILGTQFKQYETRYWSTSYRGELLITSAKRKIDDDGLDLCLDVLDINPADLPLGKAIAIVSLSDCALMVDQINPNDGRQIKISDQSETELLTGHWEPGRYAFKCEHRRELEPFPIRGNQGLWTPSQEIIVQAQKAVKWQKNN